MNIKAKCADPDLAKGANVTITRNLVWFTKNPLRSLIVIFDGRSVGSQGSNVCLGVTLRF